MSANLLSNENELPLGNSSLSRNFSLLYPADTFSDSCGTYSQLLPAVWHDLGLDNIVAAFTSNWEHQKEIAKVLSRLMRAPDIIQYRQEIIQDFLNNPTLVNRLTVLLPVIDSLVSYSYSARQDMTTLHEVAWRIGELQNIIDCIQGLADIFRDVRGKLSSTGLKTLEKEIQTIIQDSTFQNLVQELPDLLSKTRTCASVTIGVNLDSCLRPVQATLLSFNDEFFTEQSLLNKLFGIRKSQEGIAPLHSVPQRTVNGPVALPVSSDLGYAVEPMMVPLFVDLSRILEKTAKPLANQLNQYSELKGSLFTNLRQDLIFYLGAVQFIQRLREVELPMCRPEITSFAPHVCEVLDSYNANLALRHASMNGEQDTAEAIVKNDVHIGSKGHILILTGPNRGGKTTFMQGVGLVQVLAQAGCFVPGMQAQISPVDNVFTHFPLEEKPAMEMGRLGEEAARLGEIFQHVTGNSLVLLNESLSSTSFGESLYLAQDIVKALRRVGVRAIYSTHLHELANRVMEINESVTGESTVISVVSSPVDSSRNGPEQFNPTYKIETRPPLGQSYAKEIAVRYGISYEQLEQVLTERGVL